MGSITRRKTGTIGITWTAVEIIFGSKMGTGCYSSRLCATSITFLSGYRSLD
jgi:hypothetical protein